MIKVKKTSIFPFNNFLFFGEEYIGELNPSFFKPKATYSSKEGEYIFYREKFFEGTFYLSSEKGLYLAQASKPNGIGFRYDVYVNNEIYALRPDVQEGFYFKVLKNDQLIGTVSGSPYLKSKCIIEIPNVSTTIQIFMFWLALKSQQGNIRYRNI